MVVTMFLFVLLTLILLKKLVSIGLLYLRFVQIITVLFLILFGETGFRHFIVSDDEELIGGFFSEILDEEINDVYYDNFNTSIVYKTVQFNAREYNKTMTNELKKKLTPACRGLLELLVEFAKSNQNDSVICHFIDDQLQESEIYWCGVFILYFIHNLYNPILSRVSNKNNRCTMKHIKMVMEEI